MDDVKTLLRAIEAARKAETHSQSMREKPFGGYADEEAEKAQGRAKRAAGELPDVAPWLAWISAVEADDAPREAVALAALRETIAPPSPTITYPEQKPPSHPVQFVRGTAEIVLTGLEKGGEYASAEEFSASVSPMDALCLAADGRVVSDYGHACEAESRGAMPISWYAYASPKPSRTSPAG